MLIADTDIVDLSLVDLNVLKNESWSFVTFYQSKEASNDSLAYRKAVDKATSLENQPGLRIISRDGVTYMELWAK